MEPVTTITASSPQNTTTAASVVKGDMQTFLLMLTTQMRNQDPLNPMESTDFAVQLATFSGVEQQVRTNQLLEQLTGTSGLGNLGQLAGWMGLEARVAAPVGFTGAPVTISPTPASGADRTILLTVDAANQVVARQEIEITAAEMLWDGTDANGAPLPAGAYSFRLESYREGELIDTRPVETYARIAEVRGGIDGPVVVLDGGASVPAASVTALRRWS